VLRAEGLRFRYPTERFELAVDRLELEPGLATAIIGPSGCGKTTLLRLIAGILRPRAGTLDVLGEDLTQLDEAAARTFRIRNLGLVFQEFELLEYLTVAENILLPYRVSAALTLEGSARDAVGPLAAATGIEHLLASHPRQLSQGERQRVAICRALVTRPRLILADEPTGSLDPANQQRIVDLLRARAADAGAGLVMVTHDHELLGHFERTIDLPTILGPSAVGGAA
jgi:putative ABC transport system ATP-binding protein